MKRTLVIAAAAAVGLGGFAGGAQAQPGPNRHAPRATIATTATTTAAAIAGRPATGSGATTGGATGRWTGDGVTCASRRAATNGVRWTVTMCWRRRPPAWSSRSSPPAIRREAGGRIDTPEM